MRTSSLVAVTLLSRFSASVALPKDQDRDTTYVSLPGSPGTTTIIKPERESKSNTVADVTHSNSVSSVSYSPGLHVIASKPSKYVVPLIVHDGPTKVSKTITSIFTKVRTNGYTFKEGGTSKFSTRKSTITKTFTESEIPPLETTWTSLVPLEGFLPGPYLAGQSDEDTSLPFPTLVHLRHPAYHPYLVGSVKSYTTIAPGHTDYSLDVQTHTPSRIITAGPEYSRANTKPLIYSLNPHTTLYSPVYPPTIIDVDSDGGDADVYDGTDESDEDPFTLTQLSVYTVVSDVPYTQTVKKPQVTKTVVSTSEWTKTTFTDVYVTTITPSASLAEYLTPAQWARLKSLSAVASHIREADKYAKGGLGGYLRAEWAFWHAQEAARTMRLLNSSAALDYPITQANDAFKSAFDSLSANAAVTFRIKATTYTHTIGPSGAGSSDATATTSTSVFSTSTEFTTTFSTSTSFAATYTKNVRQTRDTHRDCPCAASSSVTGRSAGSTLSPIAGNVPDAVSSDNTTAATAIGFSSTPQWMHDLPAPLRSLFNDASVNKLIIFHKGDLEYEYNTGLASRGAPRRRRRRDGASSSQKKQAEHDGDEDAGDASMVVKALHASPAFDDGKRVILVDEGKITVRVNDWAKKTSLSKLLEA